MSLLVRRPEPLQSGIEWIGVGSDPIPKPDRGRVMSEEQLVAGCRSGDRVAQFELYTRTRDNIYGLLLRMTGNPDDAFDLAQETYLQAFRQIHRFRGRSSVRTWLFRIAVNQGRQFLRKAQQTERSLRVVAVEDQVRSTSEQRDGEIDVGDALAQLEGPERAMLILRYQEGMNYSAIAETFGCPQGTVASRLSRARGRMRQLLEDP